jgi:hypothetical protein
MTCDFHSGGGGNRTCGTDDANGLAHKDLQNPDLSRAANALQTGGSDCLKSALSDPDLRRVVDAWGLLPQHVRMAMIALLNAEALSR